MTKIESMKIEINLTGFSSFAITSRPPVETSGTPTDTPEDALRNKGEIIVFLYFVDNGSQRYAYKNFPSVDAFNTLLNDITNELNTLLPQ
jgi:hypothetical protein